MSTAQTAISYLERGWPLVLLRRNQKVPLQSGWKDNPIANRPQLEASMESAPTGPNLGGRE
uniref:bifunctional DNA primase/polymerase n=1 Tax=Altererythrobacter segetis TaxID=1104773 RepID=UPI00140E2B98